jgi:choline dehydrogenase-like flavoprotein
MHTTSGWEVAMAALTSEQRDLLVALVDTAVPAMPVDPDPTGFWARSGSAVGAHVYMQQVIEGVDDARSAGLRHLLDVMDQHGFTECDREAREAILHTVAASSEEAAGAVRFLRSVSCFAAAAMPDGSGRNGFWEHWGYPGPVVAPPQTQPHIRPVVPSDGNVLEADVVVVGSGAGDGTIAGVLATQGRRVVVVEAGGASSVGDYSQLEVVANQAMMYGGGMISTVDGNVGMLAGATLGGGTTINWQNCVKPSMQMRMEWAQVHGIDGLDTHEFDRHLSAVLTRMGANDRCSDFNGPHQRMLEGARALGWSTHVAVRNADEAAYDPALAGYTQFGDPSDAKRGTLRTYLEDAFDHDAQILVHTRAERIVTAGGRATGVAATYTDPVSGAQARLRVDAPHVVVACGALETPALLLRSSVGGPAVGRYLRLHPAANIFGVYADDQRAWWGPPQAAIMDEFRDLDGEGYGLLIEGSQFYTGIFGLQLARDDGKQHKEAMSKLGRMSNLLFIMREHGSGTVTVDDCGNAVHSYRLDDPRDITVFRRGLLVLAELHLAAGAEELWPNSPAVRPFTRGEDLETWLAHIEQIPIGARGIVMGSAHQMGSARMGTDPAMSVARPDGQLHDVGGVWIGDTSAFPTASGANPMLTCMALAHRTAEAIAAHR